MNVALLTTVWKRPHVTKPVLEHYTRLDAERDVYRLAVVSRNGDSEIVREAGWDAVSYPNAPLNEKHNYGMTMIQRRFPNVDAVAYVNSDQLISLYWLRHALAHVTTTADVARLNSEAFYNLDTGELAYSEHSHPGGGTVFATDILDGLDWRPWQGESIDRYLDRRLFSNLWDKGARVYSMMTTPENPSQLCSIKSDENLWSFEDHLSLLEEYRIGLDAEEYMNQHFPGVYKMLPDPNVSDKER